jgi:enterochelin esterase-like enzyme
MNRAIRMAALAAIPFLVCLAQNAPRPAAWVEPNKAEPGNTHYRTFDSRLAKGEVSYQIYLPPDYETDTTRRYPVVYWLHGLNGDQRGGMPFVRQLDSFIRSGKSAGHDRSAGKRHAQQLLQ